MSTPLPWITDRQPTQADGDLGGDVVVRLDHYQWHMTEWYNVPESTPWLAFKPAVEDGQRRRIISITRTVWMDQGGSQSHTIDAVADDGTAWWMVPGEVNWTQLPALPKSDG